MRSRLPDLIVVAALFVQIVGCAATSWFRPRAEAPAEPAGQAHSVARRPLQSGPLRIHADFPLAGDHPLVAELAEERFAISERLGVPPAEKPIDIFLSADEEAYRLRVQRMYPDFPYRRAIFVETAARMAVYAHWSDRVAEDLRHEVAHGYLHATIPGLPLWLDEGLAEYFEVSAEAESVNVPHVAHLRGQLAIGAWSPNLARLEGLPSAAEMSQTDYAEAWLWTHLMLNGSPELRSSLQAYIRNLREGRSGSLSEALSGQLPDAAAVQQHLAAFPVGRGS